MAGPKDKKPAAKGGAGKGKPKKPAYKIATLYEVSGSAVKRKNKSCPKCGEGIFLAAHKNRKTCGRCGYMEK
ncbi:MAG: 30S ribosomal protein S27ae [Nitrosarchaeum sp.]|nr:30S ribosomal protein S27ae [Nitrosarchaeum sp.]